MMSKPALLLCSLLVLGGVTAPAFARVNVDLDIGVAPPPPRVEVVPDPRPGYVWAPGYWNWEGGQHVWVDGSWMADRPGYHWVPDRWEVRGNMHHYTHGHWER
jgi:YXWGXW repeat-containing protein